MLGSSRASQRLLTEAVDAAFHDRGLGAAGSDLLAVTDLLTREKTLRLALADGGRPESERAAILSGLVGEQISPLALSLATTAVSQRWSTDADLVDALEMAGGSCIIGDAEKAGLADDVADQLFQFGRVVDGNGELQLTLSDTAVPAESKRAIVAEVLADRADPRAIELISFVVTHLRGRRVEEAIDQMVDLAAVRRGEVSAVIRVASPLEEEQERRLAAALRNLYGQPVQLSIEVDPSVVGGVSVQVGDEVIDGTIAHRIDQARRRLAG